MKRKFFVLSLAFGFVGCGHVHGVQGPVTKSEIPEGIQVGIGGQEVKPGDKVAIRKSVCKSVFKGGRIGRVNECSYEKIGEALVLKVLDHDSAIVKPDEGVKIEGDMLVEKMGDKH
ncbi:MAG: hypothetical protein A4S09_06450 [Proteobacteria bacterium SG_bin7]|nr:MAG: hypothetical protein A4S09_06450 [Proteobacteria bacterium SG_bin7]